MLLTLLITVILLCGCVVILIHQVRSKARFRALCQAEIQRRKEGERSRSVLISNLPGIVYRCRFDRNWTMEFLSEECRKLTGYKVEDLIDNRVLSFNDLIHPDDRDKVWKDWNDAVTPRAAARMEYRIITADGLTKWVFEKGVPVVDDDGRVIALEGIIIDISDRKELEDRLIQAGKMESVGRLAGGVAHDFNNMLSVIMGYTEMALEEAPESSLLFTQLEQILAAARRSKQVTRQLLAFARKQTITPRFLDLNDTVSGMLKMLQRLIGEDVGLEWQPHGEPLCIHMDPGQIDQIMANLCVNAKDAVSDTGCIIIKTRPVLIDEAFTRQHPGAGKGEYALLEVTDDGCGMDRRTLDQVFEPFFTTKEVSKGTGLGLATVYGIVKQNNGYIHIDSEPDMGTAVRIYLPVVEGEPEDSCTTPEAGPPGAQGETVLVVEDEIHILDLALTILERLGYSVIGAESPEKALALVDQLEGPVDLLITDVIMPQMNGSELARRLTRKIPEMKCLFMSGYTADVIAHHGVLEKDLQFIQKPFTVQEIAVKVRQVLDHA